jgi:hypothetical protein
MILSGDTNISIFPFLFQVIACINMLGLNNELYRSHVELKRQLVSI